MNQIADNYNYTDMSYNPLVSVIVPFLNTHNFIQESIESVLAQTYNNWELLLVDDGSSDGSTEIAQQYAKQYPDKVRYLEHEGHQNRGASASRNLGLRNANGKYIAFLDADDIWLPSNLEHFVTSLEIHPEADMVYGPTQWWYSWTGNSEDIERDLIWPLGIQPNTLVKPPELIVPLFFSQTVAVPCTCSLLIRRDKLETIGVFEEDFRYIYTDQVFYAKIFLKIPVFITGECGAKYRQHSDSSCAVVEKTGKAFAARSKFLHWLEKYLAEQKVEDPKIWQALQQTLLPYAHPFRYRLLTYTQYRVSQIKKLVKSIARQILPVGIRHWLKAQWQPKV